MNKTIDRPLLERVSKHIPGATYYSNSGGYLFFIWRGDHWTTYAYECDNPRFYPSQWVLAGYLLETMQADYKKENPTGETDERRMTHRAECLLNILSELLMGATPRFISEMFCDYREAFPPVGAEEK